MIVLLSWWVGVINTTFALLFFIVEIVLRMILSLSAVLLEELTTRQYDRVGDVVKLAFYALFENLGYRPIHAWWRLKGLIDYFRGSKEWGRMERKGIGE